MFAGKLNGTSAAGKTWASLASAGGLWADSAHRQNGLSQDGERGSSGARFPSGRAAASLSTMPDGRFAPRLLGESAPRETESSSGIVGFQRVRSETSFGKEAPDIRCERNAGQRARRGTRNDLKAPSESSNVVQRRQRKRTPSSCPEELSACHSDVPRWKSTLWHTASPPRPHAAAATV